jgi:Leucine-rich repeat (LRR) protein
LYASKQTEIRGLSFDISASLVPTSFEKCSSLRKLQWQTNGIAGSFPATLCGLGNLTKIDLSNNSLSGPRTFKLLQKLDFHSDRIFTVPQCLFSMSSLSVLNVSFNSISGSIPAEVRNLTSMTIFHATQNILSGELPRELCSMRGLLELRLSFNNLSGSIPDCIGNLTEIYSLQLAGREADNFGYLNGTLPESMSNLTKLASLHLGYQDFSGPLPEWIGRLSKLYFLELSHSKWSGPIPTWLARLPRLGYIGISRSNLTGPIPPELGTLPNLSELHVEGNELSGTKTTPGEWKSIQRLTFRVQGPFRQR